LGGPVGGVGGAGGGRGGATGVGVCWSCPTCVPYNLAGVIVIVAVHCAASAVRNHNSTVVDIRQFILFKYQGFLKKINLKTHKRYGYFDAVYLVLSVD